MKLVQPSYGVGFRPARAELLLTKCCRNQKTHNLIGVNNIEVLKYKVTTRCIASINWEEFGVDPYTLSTCQSSRYFSAIAFGGIIVSQARITLV